MATYFGFNPPFLGGQQNVMSRQEDERLIKNDLLQLIMTTPGERVHRPDFGTIVRSSLFEPMDGQMAARIQQNIYEQIKLFEPRVTTRDVTVVAHEDTNTINIRVTVSPKYDPLTDYLVEINLANQG